MFLSLWIDVQIPFHVFIVQLKAKSHQFT